jgi:hypothetical protein
MISWLGRRFLVKTFEEIEEDENLERSIQEIQQVLDGNDSEQKTS